MAEIVDFVSANATREATRLGEVIACLVADIESSLDIAPFKLIQKQTVDATIRLYLCDAHNDFDTNDLPGSSTVWWDFDPTTKQAVERWNESEGEEKHRSGDIGHVKNVADYLKSQIERVAATRRVVLYELNLL